MISNALLLTFLIIACSAFKPCEPFGPRIFYGQSIRNIKSNEKLVVYFNTISPCTNSYAHIVTKSGSSRVNCTVTSLKLSNKTNNYSTYIHKCRTSNIQYQQQFHYNVFGCDGSDSPIDYGKYTPVMLADPWNKSREVKLIFLADWSKLETNLKKYKPIDEPMLKVQAAEQINGLVILGDIGYDLDSNNGSNYQKFLVMLANSSASIPIIMITGNHEYNTKDNWSLYNESFELNGLDSGLAVGLNLGSLYLVAFDPYSLLYAAKGSQATDVVSTRLATIISQAKGNGQFIVPCSHYPLACSGTSKNCKNDRTTMKSYWDTMLNNNVSLYIGAHYHTYQRIFPYKKGDIFTTQKTGFKANDRYLISIVQGVAGNDRDIVESIDKIQSFTASYTVFQTGFGVLEVGKQNVRYRHITASKGQIDRIDISLKAVSKKSLQTQ